MERAVFLDRDNTLMVGDGDLGDPDGIRLRPGVADGLRRLRGAGYRLVVVTNQPGVANGRFTEADVDAVHERLASLVDEEAGTDGLIDRFYFCPYDPEGSVGPYRRDHDWRKPRPGMLLQAARDLQIDLPTSWMIGDHPGDAEAGRAAGCRTILVDPPGANGEGDGPTGFTEAVQTVLESRAPEPARRDEPGADPASRLEQAVAELVDELRTERGRRAEFTMVRMAATFCQLLVLLLALLALLQLGSMTAFAQWMAGAVLVQLLVIALLVMDMK
ncbi:MAG: D-glycero-alpha-D-manno-heptose-1,7-bisphosphate 7-phosphatase [Planctomycetota bacterium]